jgi:signal transduction histidine kinase
MRLRTQVLLVLLLFAVLPIIVTISSNLPQVLELLGSLHRQVYLQDLRSDFRDLDEHLVSRKEVTRLLSRLPEPGVMLGQADEGDDEQESIDLARARYTDWINHVLADQLDIIEIQFVDADGYLRFWLERNRESREWEPTVKMPVMPSDAMIREVLALQRPEVKVSPIKINPASIKTDPRHIMNLHLVSPLGQVPGAGAGGAVITTIDIGGMAQHFSKTLWSYDDGRYLEVSRQGQKGSTAFADYPGLEEQFRSRKLFLWKGPQQQIIWVPLMQTVSSGPLWVGRFVDSSSLVDFQSQLIWRVTLVVIVLLIVAWLVARYFAYYVDRLGQDLTNGISRLLEKEEKVEFTWSWSRELQLLGEKLTRLASAHVNNNRRLLAHARELEKSNRYKSEFLANVSHELRTPLNSILLLSKMLADEKSHLPSDKAEQARVIHNASRDLKSLIDDILDLAKIEAKRAALNLETVQLPQLLEELVSLMRPQFDHKQLYLKAEIAEDAIKTINTDPDKLRQVLKNFLSNAVKFTEEGGVTVSLLRGREQQRPVIISIRDTGIGIPADKHELIFQAFRQADGSTSRRYGGTGLGLGISRELAKLLGGSIELISSAGEGADFRVHLPEVFDRQSISEEQIGVDEPLLEAGAEVAEEPVVGFSGRHVLIVDSNVKNLLSLTTLMESWGFHVSGAGDIEETLEVLAEEKIDLVVMDLLMPGAHGYDTIKQIRNAYECATLPLFVLTGQVDNLERQACIEGGASEYLQRPVDPVVFRQLLGKYINSGNSSE